MVHKYERLRHISTGRFGAAFVIKIGGKLAMMKTIDIGRLDSVARKEVVEEVKVFSSLCHPHISGIYECFIEGGHLCLVMEYAEGGHAAGQVEKARRTNTDLQESHVLHWIAQAALGLKHMHDHNVIHRDLRSRKILFTSEGHVLLSSPAVTALLKDSLSLESPDVEAVRYLSPEVVDGQEHTCASDMWALGIILYELASLRPPFDHSHPRCLAEKILSGSSRQLPRRCSSEMQSLCSKLMQREPANRLSSTDLLCQPVVQEKLGSLFNQEVNRCRSPGLPSRQVPVAAATQSQRGFGPILQKSPAMTPRGLRTVGERLAGTNSGKVRTDRVTVLRRHVPRTLIQRRCVAATSIPHSPQHDENETNLSIHHILSMQLRRDSGKTSQQITEQLASEHARLHTSIMMETAMEELNFSAPHMFEDLNRWSLPTCVDTTSGATWQTDKEAQPKIAQETPYNPPEHGREFPRFA